MPPRRRARALSLVLLFLLPGLAIGEPTLPGPVAAALARVGIPESEAGLYLRDLTEDREIVSFNADRPFNPASAMKLVTTLAALEVLGPAYKWRTEAWLDGRMEGDRLAGNLVLKGYGDPKLDLEGFWLFLRDLRARGLRVIEGDLLLDRSYFAIEPTDPAAFDNEPSRPYNVGADALLINGRAFRLQFVPDEAAHAVRILAEPQLPPVLVQNSLTLGTGDCEEWPEKPEISGNVLRFSGSFPAACGEKFRYFSLLGADEYAQALFREIWTQLGGDWAGRAREAPLPAGATLLATRESPPLADLIREVNKFSVNVMARQIFLTLGATDGGIASLEKSRASLLAWLERRGLAFPELVVENGAGLSRTDRITARHLAQLLTMAWQSALMPEYVASLSLTGVDGTMKRRLAGSPASGQSHMKSGYIDGVRALAGYARDSRGHQIAAVLLLNHPEARFAQAAQDALLEWIHSPDGR